MQTNDDSAAVIRLYADGFAGHPFPPGLDTIGDIVYWADTIPAPRVLDAIAHFARHLSEAGQPSQKARYLILIGVLAQRGAFDIYKLPKDATASVADLR